jgi:hypothetical protein
MLVSVAGACSRSGKTAAAVSVLGALPPGAAAVKFTTTDDVFERCPRGSPCIVCNIDVPFRVVEDAAVLREPGTDTDRLAVAGAARVIWTIARTGAAAAAWARVAAMIARHEAAVMEGSTVVDLARPDLLLFVVHPFLSPARWKPTSPALVARADLVVINRPAGERRDPAPAVLAELERHRPRALRVADVTRPLVDWAPELAERLRAAAPA